MPITGKMPRADCWLDGITPRTMMPFQLFPTIFIRVQPSNPQSNRPSVMYSIILPDNCLNKAKQRGNDAKTTFFISPATPEMAGSNHIRNRRARRRCLWQLIGQRSSESVRLAISLDRLRHIWYCRDHRRDYDNSRSPTRRRKFQTATQRCCTSGHVCRAANHSKPAYPPMRCTNFSDHQTISPVARLSLTS